MSVSTMDSSDGLLRHVLVGAFTSGSPIRHTGGTETENQNTTATDDNNNDTTTNKNNNNSSSSRFCSITNLSHSNSTPSGSPPSLGSAFSLPTFSPLKLHHRSSPLSNSPSTSGARVTPTTWMHQQSKHPRSSSASSSSSLSSSFSSPQRKTMMSPILNLAKIDETKVLKTSLLAETPEQATNPNVPYTLITTATPQEDNSVLNQSFGCPGGGVKPLPSMTDFDNVSLRLRKLSVSPALDSRSPGLIVSPGDGIHKRYLKFRRSDITMGRMIGKGGFGCVYEGSICGSPVAVKIVQKRRGSGIHREILQAERLAFKLNLRHENIVGIYGVNLCEELRGDALILMELVASQSLQTLIDAATTPIHVRDRLGYALQVARGLEYLHENCVVHLDVKPANVLITSDHVCKMSDFGNLTQTGPRVQQEEPEFTQLLGTLPYRAPELMTGLFPTTKADVYSFGIILWQMLTRESPHKSANPHALIYQVVKWDIRPSVPETGNDVIENMYKDLYTSCWSREVEKRPDASEVIVKVEKLMHHILSS